MAIRIIIVLVLLTLKLSAQDCTVDSLGRKQGPCTEVLDKEFIVREGNYVEGKLHGPYVIRYTWDKGPLIIARGNYKNGQKHGLVIEYDVSGRISSTWPYEDGILHGVVTRYSKGRVLTVERYDKGVASGLWQTFHRNGRPKTYFYCKDGVFGPVHYLDKNGGVEKIVQRKKKSK
jgi:antitoxin component YwqK of YwqJK toxin-antitoxin module